MNNLFFQWLSGSVDGDGDEDDGHIDQLVYEPVARSGPAVEPGVILKKRSGRRLRSGGATFPKYERIPQSGRISAPAGAPRLCPFRFGLRQFVKSHAIPDLVTKLGRLYSSR